MKITREMCEAVLEKMVDDGIFERTGEFQDGYPVYRQTAEYQAMDEATQTALLAATDRGEN